MSYYAHKVVLIRSTWMKYSTMKDFELNCLCIPACLLCCAKLLFKFGIKFIFTPYSYGLHCIVVEFISKIQYLY